jgi:hypothetical protein
VAIEFSSGETTIGALVNLRGDIARLRRDIDPQAVDDCLYAEAGEALTLLDDVIANLTRRSRDNRAVRVNQLELNVISAAVLVSRALAFFFYRAPSDGILQRLH